MSTKQFIMVGSEPSSRYTLVIPTRLIDLYRLRAQVQGKSTNYALLEALAKDAGFECQFVNTKIGRSGRPKKESKV